MYSDKLLLIRGHSFAISPKKIEIELSSSVQTPVL